MARTKPSSNKSKKPTSSPPTWDEQLINKLMPYRLEMAGLFLFIVAMITFLALLGITRSNWLNLWTNLLNQAFGWGAYALSLLVAAAGVHMMLRKVKRPYRVRPAQVVALELILLPALALSHQLAEATLVDAYQGEAGGLVGWALSDPLQEFFGPFLTTFFYLTLVLWGIALLIGLRWVTVHRLLWRVSHRSGNWAAQVAPDVRAEPPTQKDSLTPTPLPIRQAPQTLPAAPISTEPSGRRDRRLPPLTLLEKGTTARVDDNEVVNKKEIIEQTLADFGIPVEVTQIRRGPAVTQYGVLPGYIERIGPDGEIKQHKIRIGQIASLRRDLALALAAPRLRIQAPIPGRGVVGIEVPNDEVNLVRLRDVIESDEFIKIKAPLAVGLGRNVSGEAEAIDLAKLPHLLIAGTTGSGKSICINAFISCLVFNNPPEQLHLIMIDPKKVELVRFNGLPHLIGKVEVDADRAVGVLRWLTAEMDRRYEMFAQAGARNLNGYNRRMRQQAVSAPLPHIAVFIDELADLMYMYPGDVERTLCRLAQMARATGIHLVVATQRPSTDVITGLIKANFPARLSFAVASGTDSRVVLDSVGAEQLLGRGDMLFLAPDASGPMRIQGIFVTDTEVEQLVTFWQKMRPNHVPVDPPWETLIAKHALLDQTDTLLEAAIELAKKNDHLSASFLQRRLRLGYPRAARLMEHLYEMGLVDDPKSGGKTRKTYTNENDDPLNRILTERE